MYRTFREVWSCGFWDKWADKQRNRQLLHVAWRLFSVLSVLSFLFILFCIIVCYLSRWIKLFTVDDRNVRSMAVDRDRAFKACYGRRRCAQFRFLKSSPTCAHVRSRSARLRPSTAVTRRLRHVTAETRPQRPQRTLLEAVSKKYILADTVNRRLVAATST